MGGIIKNTLLGMSFFNIVPRSGILCCPKRSFLTPKFLIFSSGSLHLSEKCCLKSLNTLCQAFYRQRGDLNNVIASLPTLCTLSDDHRRWGTMATAHGRWLSLVFPVSYIPERWTKNQSDRMANRARTRSEFLAHSRNSTTARGNIAPLLTGSQMAGLGV